MHDTLWTRRQGSNTGKDGGLPPGLWLVDVRPNGRVVWVELPDSPADRALPLDAACDALLKPALAMVRQEREG